jgi:hypothetical protein
LIRVCWEIIHKLLSHVLTVIFVKATAFEPAGENCSTKEPAALRHFVLLSPVLSITRLERYNRH